MVFFEKVPIPSDVLTQELLRRHVNKHCQIVCENPKTGLLNKKESIDDVIYIIHAVVQAICPTQL